MTPVWVHPRKIEFAWEEALRVVAHTLAELGVSQSDYAVRADAFHTRRFYYVDQNHRSGYRCP